MKTDSVMHKNKALVLGTLVGSLITVAGSAHRVEAAPPARATVFNPYTLTVVPPSRGAPVTRVVLPVAVPVAASVTSGFAPPPPPRGTPRPPGMTPPPPVIIIGGGGSPPPPPPPVN